MQLQVDCCDDKDLDIMVKGSQKIKNMEWETNVDEDWDIYQWVCVVDNLSKSKLNAVYKLINKLKHTPYVSVNDYDEDRFIDYE